jgi:heme exporter protein C
MSTNAQTHADPQVQSLTQRLANPTRFMALSGRILPWLTAAAVAVILYGLYLTFFVAPPDYQQGETVKIMFIHVPSAWLGMVGYLMIAISSFGLLVFRHPLADVSAKAAAPIGAAFTLLALITGSLWGKPMWGTYWVWDARLTSVLILFFLYLGLMALRSSLEDESLAAKQTAVLGLAGVVILPIIKFSVDWWNTLHQPASVVKLDGPAIHSSILIPLMVNAVGFSLLFFALHMKGMRNEVLRRRVKALRMAEVEQAARGREATVSPAG